MFHIRSYLKDAEKGPVRGITAVLCLTGAGAVCAAHEVPITSQQMERLGISAVQVERAASLVTDRLQVLRR